MNPSDYQKVKEIFNSVLEIKPEGRAAFLDSKCNGENGLRAEVERLLASCDSEFLETPAVAPFAEDVARGSSHSGQMIGHYSVITKIGSGGMGDVYLAEDGKLGRRVAIKILPKEFTNVADRLSRFRLEARSASSLTHPNILTIHEIGEWEGTHYIATEYVEGETLRHRLHRERLTIDESLEYGVQIVSAVAAAHEAGVTHRDIKPENIMIRRDGLVKILDFGLAKFSGSFMADASPVSNDGPTVRIVNTEPGIIMGTVQYMSPEQARGNATDARTDIWSIGCVLYEMLTGGPPFSGGNSADLIAEIVKTYPKSPSEYDPEIPERLDEIVAKSLEKNPDERYQTAKDLLIDLKRLRRRFDFEGGSELLDSAVTTDPGNGAVTGPNLINTKSGPKDLTTVRGTEYFIWGIRAHRVLAVGILLLIFGLLGGTALLVRNYWRGPNEALIGDSGKLGLADPRGLVTFFENAPANKVADGIRTALSSNGKLIAYTQVFHGRESLWLHHIETGRKTQIGNRTEGEYSTLRFSPDNEYVYFVSPRSEPHQYDLYRVSVFGGPPRKISENVSGEFSVSEGGIVYVRYPFGSTECRMYLADMLGASERLIATRKKSHCYGLVRWSPDLKSVVASVLVSEPGEHSIELVAVDIKNGEERSMTEERWTTIRDVAWMAGQDVWVVAGRKNSNTDFNRLWYLDPKSEKAFQMSKESVNFNSISIAGDGRSLVATQVSLTSNLAVYDTGNVVGSEKLIVSAYGSVAWALSERLYYTTPNERSLWAINPDGSEPQQIDTPVHVHLTTSADGRYLVSARGPKGIINLWRMNSDGSDARQLTFGEGAQRPNLTPDNRWVYYEAKQGNKLSIWKVPFEGGDPMPVIDGGAVPTVSPDGTQLAYFEQPNDDLVIVDLETLAPLNRFPAPMENIAADRIQWSLDNQWIYIAAADNTRVGNIWRVSLRNGQTEKLTSFSRDQLFDFQFSPDESRIAMIRGEWLSQVVLIDLSRDASSGSRYD